MTDITTALTYTADLTRPLRRMNIPALFITDARRAHRIAITVLRAGNPVDLGGTAVSGTVKHLRTGTTIPLDGSTQDSIASVTLPPAAYAQPGDIEIYVTLTSGDVQNCIFAATGCVFPSSTDRVADVSGLYSLAALQEHFSSLEERLRALEEVGLPVVTDDQLVSAQPLTAWKFRLISPTADADDTSTAEAAPTYNDADWRTVSVPHDWSAELDFNADSPAGCAGGYLDGGDAWYRTNITVDKQSGRRYVLCFDGVSMEAAVYINGQLAQKKICGYAPFAVDATGLLTIGANMIAVFVRSEKPSARGYSGSGLIRPVELLTLLDNQVRMENIRVTTPKVDSDLTNGETVVAFDAVNRTGASAAATFTVDLYDPSGAKVGTADTTATMAAGAKQTFRTTLAYFNPKLWHIGDETQRREITGGRSTMLSGSTLHCENALAGKPFGALRVYGKCTQDGTPAPTAPVPIATAGDGGTVTVSISNGAGASRTLTLQTPSGLPGLKVTSGGNYTDEDGQQWLCDEVDLARGVYVQRVGKIKLTSAMRWQSAGNKVDRYFATFAVNPAIKEATLCTHFAASLGGETVGGMTLYNKPLIGFAFAEKGTTTVADFKQFLDENDVYIVDALATPMETALSADEIATYQALTTYTPTTIITAGGAGLAASYQQNILPDNAPISLLSASPANRYEAQVSVKIGNRVQQSQRVPYGYRSIRFDKDTGFSLNGIRTKLKGVCIHPDSGCIGAAENRSAIERQVDLLMAMGCNAIRLMRSPRSAVYLDVCQRKGLLVVEELFDGWAKGSFGQHFADCWAEVVTSMIRRDGNNPAVILWSLGSDVRSNLADGDYTDSEITSLCTTLSDAVKALDTTRPTTLSNNAPGGNLAALMSLVDVVGISYNGNNQTYQPDRPIYGSETTSALSSRGVYETNSTDMTYASYDGETVSGGSTAAETVNAFLSSARSCGHFVHAGFDYLGEPEEWNKYPAKSSYVGIVDTCGFPKDIYYMYQSMWTDAPMIHILPHWTHPSGNIDVWLYANCAAVELFLNGTSLGRKTLDARGAKNQYAYTVPFVPGTLVANGYDARGNLVAQDIQYTAGSAAKLTLASDKTAVNTASDDLVYVTCCVADKSGTLCPNAANSVTFSVTGGTIVGTDNGHGANVEKLSGSTHAAFSGKCLCVVKHDGISGTMTISAASDGLTAAAIEVTKGDATLKAADPAVSFVDAANPPMRETDLPIISAVRTDKTTAALNEDITFTLTVKNTTSIRVYIDGSVNRYIYDVTDGELTYKLAFTSLSKGTRTVVFEPCRGDMVGAKTPATNITLTNS